MILGILLSGLYCFDRLIKAQVDMAHRENLRGVRNTSDDHGTRATDGSNGNPQNAWPGAARAVGV